MPPSWAARRARAEPRFSDEPRRCVAATAGGVGSDNRKSKDGTAPPDGERSSGRRASSRGMAAASCRACGWVAEASSAPVVPSPSLLQRGPLTPSERYCCIVCQGLRRMRTGGLPPDEVLNEPEACPLPPLSLRCRPARAVLSAGSTEGARRDAVVLGPTSCPIVTDCSVALGGVDKTEGLAAFPPPPWEGGLLFTLLFMPARTPPPIFISSSSREEVGGDSSSEVSALSSARPFPFSSFVLA